LILVLFPIAPSVTPVTRVDLPLALRYYAMTGFSVSS